MGDLMNSHEVADLADFVNRGGREVSRCAVAALPVIDISPFMQPGRQAEQISVAAELRQACINIGFFYMTGHGIAQTEFEEEIAWGHRFFEQAPDEKMKVHKSLAASNLGFMNVGGVNPELNKDKESDLKETFTFNREPMPGEPQGYRMGVGESQWPQAAALTGFQPFMTGQLKKRIVVAQNLLRAFALSLHLPEDYFDASHRYIGCNFTYNYYPAMDPARAKRTQWGISPHTDYGSFTLLSQDALGGLEVRNASGDWIAVPPVAGSLVVNIGDLFARWTNDLYTSNFHRATNYNPDGKARISVPFFVYPHASVEIECLATCQSADNPPSYEPVNAVDYVRSLIKRSYETGRPGVARESVSRLQRNSTARAP